LVERVLCKVSAYSAIGCRGWIHVSNHMTLWKQVTTVTALISKVDPLFVIGF